MDFIKVIDDNMKKEVLEHYNPEQQIILNKQIDVMNELIAKNAMRYQYSNDFRKAIDLLLVEMLNGNFLG